MYIFTDHLHVTSFKTLSIFNNVMETMRSRFQQLFVWTFWTLSFFGPHSARSRSRSHLCSPGSVYVDICNIDVMVRRLWAWRDGAEYTLSLVELSSFALKHLVGSHINTQLGMFSAVSCRRHNEVLFVTVYGLVRVCGTKYIHRISSLTAVSSCSGRLF